MTTTAQPPGPPEASNGPSTPHEGLIVGRFELEEFVGEGRLGSVWRARDLGTGIAFAIKFVVDPPPDVVSRLENEMRAWRWVRQRNLVPITEVVDDGGLVGVVCPFVEGTPLSDVLTDGSAMELSEAIPLFRALLDALTTAHAAGRVHGALYPANVLLEIDEVRINPRVTDAGLGVALGLPVETNPARARYVAPEVGVDGSGSVSADVFALGVMLYEMVSGQPPFTDRPIPEAGRVEYTPLDVRVPDCPALLARAVDRALMVDPADRFDTVVAFKGAILPLDRWLADEPTQLNGSDWGDVPVRSSIRTRTLSRDGTDPGRRPAAAAEPVAPVAPVVPVAPAAPVARVPAPVRPTAPTPIAVPPPEPPARTAPAAAPAGVVPVARTPMVIQLAPEHVHAENADLVRELGELNATPDVATRWGVRFFQYAVAPVGLVLVLVLGQSWRAGEALHDARLAHTRARTDVDADVAAAGGYVERLIALGAPREIIEPPLLALRREKDLLTRSDDVDAVRDLLASVIRNLPAPTKPEDILEDRVLKKGIDGLGGNSAAHEAAVTGLADAEAMLLSRFADEWGFAEDDPVNAVLDRLMGTPPAE